MINNADRFNPLDYPLALKWPRLLTPGSAWVPHTPFAMALVDLCRPDRIVELGSLHGDSYCSMCQAVQTLKLPTRCTAVDTWQGDPHAGNYGPAVLQTLREHHDPLYGAFSTLLQKTFDEAVAQFEDASVDLLHIDGFHSYDAVKHDFETWQPKLSRRGVVIFHDTQVRDPGFGVWKFWGEVSRRYPNFEFHHSFGLGVLAVGAEPPPPVVRFLEVANRESANVREYFNYLGQAVGTSRMAITMLSNVQRLEGLLNKRKQMVGEPIATLDIRSPLKFMEAVMLEVQAVVVADLRQRGFDVRAEPPPSPQQGRP